MKQILLLVVALLLFSGCSKDETQSTTSSAPVLSQQFRSGSILVGLTLNETNISTSGTLQLALEIHAPPQATVIFPELENQINPLRVVDGYTEPNQPLPNHKISYRRVWWLAPALPGTATIQPLEIRVDSTTLKTQPITVHINSLLPKGITDFEIKDIADPIQFLPEEKRQHKIILLALGGTVGFILLVFGIKRLRKPPTVIILSPHEAAAQALANLSDDPLEKTNQLSHILCTFVADYFHLTTTGKTIHEIFPLLPKERLLGRRYKLEAFLLDADAIRFSHQLPDHFADDFEQFTRHFIEEMPCD